MILETMKKMLWRERVPAFLPKWWQDRININTLHMHRLMQQASDSLPAGTLVIDAGAGEGRFKPYFAHTHYIGIDFGLGDASWNYRSLDVMGDIARMPIAENVADAVICTQTLEHVPEPAQVITELARVLKPGGSLYLAAPQNWHQHQKPYDFFRYTSFGLRYLFEKAGLEPLLIEPMGGYFWFLSLQFQMMHHWLLPKEAFPLPLQPLRLLLSLALRMIFVVLLPLPLYYLDRLDRVKDQTLGYICHCHKPAS